MYNPTPNTLNVRWEPATGQVQQYRVAYAPLTGASPSESVSSFLQLKHKLSLAAEFSLRGGKSLCLVMRSEECEDTKITTSCVI